MNIIAGNHCKCKYFIENNRNRYIDLVTEQSEKDKTKNIS